MTRDGHRRLLGWLLLWSMLPLPFLYIVLPPFWLVAAAVAVLLVARPSLRIPLPLWSQNLIAVAIVIVVAAAGGLRIGPLRPLGHLLLLLTSVRALLVVDRRSFLGALMPTLLVWVVSVTASTHVMVMLYVAASAVVWWWAGMRIQLAGIAGQQRHGHEVLPRAGHAAFAAIVALAIMVPFFVAIPRISSPWIAGSGGASSVTGFSSHVDLAGVGTIRQSHEVALFVRTVGGSQLQDRWMRLRATALERVMTNSWAPRGATLPPVERGGLFWLYGKEGSLKDTVELEIEILRPRRYLFQPEGTVAVASPFPVLLDPTGGMVLARRVHGPMTYTVWVARSDPPYPSDPPRTGANRFPMHPEVRRLTEEIVAGARTDRERVEAIERHLQQNFTYSLSGMTHLRADPVTWFLLEERSGHCEYFAGAMVAMLDELDIPARMVAGYSGGELAPNGTEAAIRESNAHSWVEVKLGRSRFWMPYDPTPASEVPTLSRRTGRDRLRMGWDWVQTSWDRYVLTFGISEQMRLMAAAADGFEVLGRQVSWRRLPPVAVAVLSALLAWWWWRGRRTGVRRRRSAGPPAATAVQRLADRLQAGGLEVPRNATVRWVARQASVRWPEAAAAVRELAFRAERELYAAEPVAPNHRAAVRRLWLQTLRAMRDRPAADRGR